jgi:predicted membrane protein
MRALFNCGEVSPVAWYRLNQAQREGLIAWLLASIGGICAEILMHTTNRLAALVSALALAITLFFMRVKFRGLYGALEVLFGTFVLWNVGSDARGGFGPDFSSDFAIFRASVVIIQTVGGIYIVVRGLDNLFQSLPDERRRRLEARIKSWRM